jgi:glycosyltransferase involved in cell wall biosynthesis
MNDIAPISAIIPHHNRSHLIGQAIDSIQRQTLQPLEILIVDDCSKAEHIQALQQYRDIADIVLLDKNGGAARARNEGIRRAKGEFIAFLDDDDQWLPERLEMQWNIMRNDPSLQAVAAAMTIRYQDGSEELLLSHAPEIMTVQTALEGTPAMLQTLLIRTAAMRQLGGFDSDFLILDDREFWIRFTAAGLRAHYLSRPLAVLERSDRERLTRNWTRYTAEEIKVVDKHAGLYEKTRGKGAVRRERSKILRRAGIRKGRMAGRLAYIGGCVLGGEWSSLARLLTTAKMTEVPYAKG